MEENKSIAGKFKVMEEIFFGGKVCIASGLSYKKAVDISSKYEDMYTNRYILPNDYEDSIYDYDARVSPYLLPD